MIDTQTTLVMRRDLNTDITMVIADNKATNLHARRNKHIWKLVFFLEKIVIISKTTWNASKHINHGSCQQEQKIKVG